MGIVIPQLDPASLAFPDVRQALGDPNGLLAFGGDLSPQRLIAAYENGIFPWYEETLADGSPSPILWWCPTPRCVLFVDEVKFSKSLRKRARNGGFELSCDQAFGAVINHCASQRAYAQGTWITDQMQQAYCELHSQGYAHSIECWKNDVLVGGLYGVAIGGMYFGESMFSLEKDASKIALIYLCNLLKQQGSLLIDCQVANAHLLSMGAREIQLDAFLANIKSLAKREKLVFPQQRVEAKSLLITS